MDGRSLIGGDRLREVVARRDYKEFSLYLLSSQWVLVLAHILP